MENKDLQEMLKIQKAEVKVVPSVQAKIAELKALFAAENLAGHAMLNEFLRYRAVDQLLSSSASVHAWGISLEDLFELVKTSTIETLGKVPYEIETFQRLYRRSFMVGLTEFLVGSELLSDVFLGEIWRFRLEDVWQNWLQDGAKGKICFAWIENYLGLLEDILEVVPAEKLCLHTQNEVLYEALTKLYPLIEIKGGNASWDAGEIDYLMALAVGETCQQEMTLEDMASLCKGLGEQGKGYIWLDTAFVYSLHLGCRRLMSDLYSWSRLSAITEWLGLGAYEFEITANTTQKISLSLAEHIAGEIKEESLIPLPGAHIAQLPNFSLAWYSLSLQNGGQADLEHRLSLGSEGYLRCPVGRGYTGTTWETMGLYGLFFIPTGDTYVVHLSSSWEYRGNFADAVVWTFGEERTCHMWWLYFRSVEGRNFLRRLTGLGWSMQAAVQLLACVGRPVLEVAIEEQISAKVKLQQELFKARYESLQQEWHQEIHKLTSFLDFPTVSGTEKI